MEGVEVFAAPLIALVLVAWSPVWRLTRPFVTIVHEAGHAVAAVLSGRRLEGVRLHSDASGLTLSRGRSRGPGMVATAFFGYPAPGLAGLLGAGVVALGYGLELLWVVLGGLALLLLWIRNLYGLVSVLLAGGSVFAVTWWGDDAQQAFAAVIGVWFLLLGSLRPVGELRRLRRTGRARSSDADMLARLTPLPGGAWVALFGLVNLGSLVLGGYWLLEPSEVFDDVRARFS